MARSEATRLFALARGGDPASASTLAPLVYDELREIAAGYLRRERPDHTLQPTALVHEAYVRLVDAEGFEPRDEAHFLAIAANVMRRVLVEHARARAAEKRGGGARRVTLESGVAVAVRDEIDVLALEEALVELAALDARQARVVELRVYGGLSVEEAAGMLGVSKRSVESDWTLARAFLYGRLARS